MDKKTTFIIVVIAIISVIAVFYFSIYEKNPEENIIPNVPVSVSTTTEYKNTEYGFTVSLPKSWENYSVVVDNWEGYSLINEGRGQELTEVGPLIYIRHPKWTEEDPRQDIPVMVFTLKQWADLEADKFHIGAAPFGPAELGRNGMYIFGLPARYNYAFPTGFEEVEEIIQSGALKAF